MVATPPEEVTVERHGERQMVRLPWHWARFRRSRGVRMEEECVEDMANGDYGICANCKAFITRLLRGGAIWRSSVDWMKKQCVRILSAA